LEALRGKKKTYSDLASTSLSGILLVSLLLPACLTTYVLLLAPHSRVQPTAKEAASQAADAEGGLGALQESSATERL